MAGALVATSTTRCVSAIGREKSYYRVRLDRDGDWRAGIDVSRRVFCDARAALESPARLSWRICKIGVHVAPSVDGAESLRPRLGVRECRRINVSGQFFVVRVSRARQAEDSQRIQVRAVRVKANRGDMLGNNNVHFSPGPGSTSASNVEILRKNHVPLYVMLPKDIVSTSGRLTHVKALQASLSALKLIGVDGVMMHVWWGNVEGEEPEKYNWSAYIALVKMVNAAGLKLQASLCFHGSGVTAEGRGVQLPSWIHLVGESNPDIFYTDRSGNRNKECLSLAIDQIPLFNGRSSLQIYADLMDSFRETFALYLGNTIVEVLVGLGPAGELRYPAFPEGIWRFPGVGEFQCYDKYMLANLREHAMRLGQSVWGAGGPIDAGSYNDWPNETGFFDDTHGSWNSPFGEFFLAWYSGALVEHGDLMLSLAVSKFKDEKIVVAGKLPGIHWWRRTKSHAAELTAGFFNSQGREGYDPAVEMFARNDALVVVPCMEMGDDEQLPEAKCSPESFLLQVRRACARYGVPIAGENSLLRFDDASHVRIKTNIHRWDCPGVPRMAAFTFFRMGESLFSSSNWQLFANFVQTINKDTFDQGYRASLDEECKLSYAVQPVGQKHTSRSVLHLQH